MHTRLQTLVSQILTQVWLRWHLALQLLSTPLSQSLTQAPNDQLTSISLRT